MKLPTEEEIEAASERWGREGPEPVAAAIDQSPEMTRQVKAVVKAIEAEFARLKLSDIVKSGMVYGLSIGIRIGEARALKIRMMD